MENKSNKVNPHKIQGMKPEDGVTSVSLSNARILTNVMGKPSLVVLTRRDKITTPYEYITTAYWGTKNFKFEFTGFSWGFGGEGPNGLLTYLKELGAKVDITAIAKLQDKDLPKVFET